MDRVPSALEDGLLFEVVSDIMHVVLKRSGIFGVKDFFLVLIDRVGYSRASWTI